MPPGCTGAVRPENRVTARSIAPQNKCTGLHLPMKRVRNCLEHTIGLQERAPESIDRVGVIRPRLLVLRERNGNRQFVRVSQKCEHGDPAA